jgi:uncharacterized protein YodC (DUF2158 family)
MKQADEADQTPPEPRPIEVGEVVNLCVAGCPDECIENCPDMTVTEINRGDAVCCWFGADGSYHQETFHVSRLSRELEVPKEGEVKKGRKKTEKRMVAGAKPASQEPPPFRDGVTGPPSAPAGGGGEAPAKLGGEGAEGGSAPTNIGGPEAKQAGAATAKAEASKPAAPHPTTPHAKGK